jgi:hypothetical protein
MQGGRLHRGFPGFRLAQQMKRNELGIQETEIKASSGRPDLAHFHGLL